MGCGCNKKKEKTNAELINKAKKVIEKKQLPLVSIRKKTSNNQDKVKK
jgi:hypothetical protein